MTAHSASRGSAPAEFALVGALMVAVFGAVTQLGVDIHVRDVLVAAAAEGARTAAAAGQSLAAGEDRTRALITQALSASYARQVQVRYAVMAGVRVVVVRVRTPLPLLGLAGPAHGLDVSAHAVTEVP